MTNTLNTFRSRSSRSKVWDVWTSLYFSLSWHDKYTKYISIKLIKIKSIRCCDVRVSRAHCWNSEGKLLSTNTNAADHSLFTSFILQDLNTFLFSRCTSTNTATDNPFFPRVTCTCWIGKYMNSIQKIVNICKGRIPQQIGWIFGKVPKGGGHFQSKNLYCILWTFKQGYPDQKGRNATLWKYFFV